jgi:hypothetical protein
MERDRALSFAGRQLVGTTKVVRDRSKTNLSHPQTEVRFWVKGLRVSREALEKAVGKVGNAAAAVRKEPTCPVSLNDEPGGLRGSSSGVRITVGTSITLCL